MNLITGVDIGGSHISSALVDLETKKIVPGTLCRKLVNSKEPADLVINQWAQCIQESHNKGGVSSTRLGVAIPAPFDYEKGICLIKDQDKFDLLYNINVRDLLADALGMNSNDIAMENDASCFMLGEMIVGAGRNNHRALGVTLGTGLGSAFATRLDVQDAGLWNTPFNDSIAEEYISIRWFLNSYFSKTKQRVSGVKELSQRADSDPIARELFREFGQSLGQFISIAIKQISDEPELVILGGNIAKSHHLFLDETIQILSKQGVTVPIKVAELGELSAIFGAAGLWEHANSSEDSLRRL